MLFLHQIDGKPSCHTLLTNYHILPRWSTQSAQSERYKLVRAVLLCFHSETEGHRRAHNKEQGCNEFTNSQGSKVSWMTSTGVLLLVNKQKNV